MKVRDSFNRQILKIALPSIVSNITVPLLGMIDVAIVGHMGGAVYIGAVAVGSMIFNLVYWLFGFLRMSTSGLTAQAYGRQSSEDIVKILAHSATTALLIALLLIVLQWPLRWLMFWLIGPTSDVVPLAATYFRIVIWGAPASLLLFVIMGWFIGLQNSRVPMVVSILQNIVNIVASLTLVYGCHLKIEGVAIGTVIAQYAGLLTALWFTLRRMRHFSLSLHFSLFTRHYTRRVSDGHRAFSLNRDLFLRTLCLVGVNLYFTSAGARQGAVILSVNTVMLQLYLFFSYFMDGFANAGEALGGRYYGARDSEAFRSTLRHLFGWTAALTALFTLIYIFGGLRIVALLTDEPAVVSEASHYIFWAWLIPIAGSAAFIWDGIFVGLTATRGMLISSLLATLTFFVIHLTAPLVFHPSPITHHPTLFTSKALLNHALWLAQVVYLAMRGIIQTLWYRRRLRF